MEFSNLMVWIKKSEINNEFYGPFESQQELDEWITKNNIVVDNDRVKIYCLIDPDKYS